MTTAEEVWVRDVSNGRVHVRYKRAGVRGLYSLENDNADDSGAYQVLTEVEKAEVEEDNLCLRCFPRPE